MCIGPSPNSAKLVHTAQRMAADLKVRWFALYVESPKMVMLSEEEYTQAADNLRLVEQLGAETVTPAGRNIAEKILNFAGERNITRIIVGKPRHSLWKSIFLLDPVDRIWVENRPDSSAAFKFVIPVEGTPPPLIPEKELL